MFLLLKMISANCCKWVKYSAIGGFLKGLWKSHRMGHFQILESAGICVLEYKRKPIEMTEFQWVLRNYRIDSGATSNRKSVYIALFLNKLYLYYDVSPLNKVFTTLHRSTQVCVLGSISACKGRYLFGIINISKNFFCIYC